MDFEKILCWLETNNKFFITKLNDSLYIIHLPSSIQLKIFYKYVEGYNIYKKAWIEIESEPCDSNISYGDFQHGRDDSSVIKRIYNIYLRIKNIYGKEQREKGIRLLEEVNNLISL